MLNPMKVDFSHVNHKEEIIFINLTPAHNRNILGFHEKILCLFSILEEDFTFAIVKFVIFFHAVGKFRH